MNTKTINADKIRAWRDTNPDKPINERVLLDILGVDSLRNADLTGANLTGADLTYAYLMEANLASANLTDANLRRAILTRANLWGARLMDADLRGADLTNANLRRAMLLTANMTGTYLWGADLTDAELRSANLWGVKLTGANLTNANLTNANLTFSTGGVTQISNLYPYPATLQPTPYGWCVRVGCWYGTLEALREIATSDNEDDWPEARGEEYEQRRPLLQAMLVVFDAHVANHPDIIEALDNQWGE